MTTKPPISLARRCIRAAKDTWLLNPLRRWIIKRKQRQYIEACDAHFRRLVIFLVPGYDIISGGIMSIISISDETDKILSSHDTDIFVCSLPGEPPLLRYTKFINKAFLCDFQMVISRCDKDANLLIHIPEDYVSQFIRHGLDQLKQYKSLKYNFNIMLQNIDYIPHKTDIDILKDIGSISVTTAHKAYADSRVEELFGCKLWHLSTFVSPEQYEYRSYENKKNIVIVSPDYHHNRSKILESLMSVLHEYEFIVVRKMTYQQYKSLIAEAKFSLTFGEGLDGYFVEPIFSGGIGCAVFNERFFTESYRNLPCMYSSWEELIEMLPRDIKALNNQVKYTQAHLTQFNLLASNYSYQEYQRNLDDFYRERFPISHSNGVKDLKNCMDSIGMLSRIK